MIDNINWYPGHMKKTRELIQNNMKMVDAVIEVIDARIPVSSRNPIIDELVSAKPRIIAINKSDLADENANRAWKQKLTSKPDDAKAGETQAVIMNSLTGEGTKQLFSSFEQKAAERTGSSFSTLREYCGLSSRIQRPA